MIKTHEYHAFGPLVSQYSNHNPNYVNRPFFSSALFLSVNHNFKIHHHEGNHVWILNEKEKIWHI